MDVGGGAVRETKMPLLSEVQPNDWRGGAGAIQTKMGTEGSQWQKTLCFTAKHTYIIIIPIEVALFGINIFTSGALFFFVFLLKDPDLSWAICSVQKEVSVTTFQASSNSAIGLRNTAQPSSICGTTPAFYFPSANM